MQGFLDQIGTFIQAHQAWAGPLVALLTFVECFAVLGILIPAPPVMLAIGGLIGGGLIDPLSTVGGAMLGAAAGFFASYLAGRWLGPGILHRWPLRNYRPIVARARLLFRRYATFAVFISRFIGPLRVTVPLIGGIMGMSHHRFQLANLTSAVIWAPLFLAPGWLAARGMGTIASLSVEHWVALGLGGLALAAGLVILGLRLQRERLARRRRLEARAARRLQAAPAAGR